MAQRAAGGGLRRFEAPEIIPGAALRLRLDHSALVDARTIFPGNVRDVAESQRFLISGANNSKIGKAVAKGPWAGMPIFTLTLEERATCPRSCAMWSGCYGNAMQWPSRWNVRDPEFLDTLRAEVITTARLHPKGLVVRLHVLGDFFSVRYVEFWAEMIGRFPQLCVYGYTARRTDADDAESREIAAHISGLIDLCPERFAIRFSRTEPGAGHAIVVDEAVSDPSVIMCPAQTHDTETCGTCGLCRAPSMRGKTIAFLRHGMKRVHGVRADVAAPARMPPPNRATNVNIRGRRPIGALPGETAERRDVRIREWAMAKPGCTVGDVVGEFGVTRKVAERLWGAALTKAASVDRPASWLPPQRFKPTSIPPTPEERIANVAATERERIAREYGATFKGVTA